MENAGIPREEWRPAALPQKERVQAYEKLAAFLALVIGYLFVSFILFHSSGISVTLFTLIFAGAALFFFKKSGKPLSCRACRWLCIVLALSLYFPLSDNRSLKPLALLALIFAAAYWLVLLGGHELEPSPAEFFPADMLNALVLYPFRNFLITLYCIFLPLEKRDDGKSRKTALYILLGLIAALPAAALIISNLRGDEMFDALWTHLFDFVHIELSDEVFWKIFLSLPVSFYLFGLAYASARDRKTDKLSRASLQTLGIRMRIAPSASIYAAMIPILVIYILYFVSQLGYFLSAFSSILPTGLTYADYARRGFFELCCVCLINLCIVTLANRVAHADAAAAARRLCLALNVFTLLLITTAISKMALYVKIYGLTPLRLYTSYFMLFLFACFTLISIWLISGKPKPMRVIVKLGMVMFALLLLAGPNRIIANYNVSRYLNGSLSTISPQYIASLGAESRGALKRLAAEDENPASRDQVNEAFKELAFNGEWQAWNLPAALATREYK
ncbi:MAG: DUF4173 domain-containing protein [Clostridia bacterium]|nr:DUF4173 domain-containing protein [Clostridia bacterium]